VRRGIRIVVLVALVASACSGGSAEPPRFETPEQAVAAWFDAIDGNDAASASSAIRPDSLALILSSENGLTPETTSDYIENGIPMSVQEDYWASFADGFSAFASRPVSTLTVGQASMFDAGGTKFARVPVSGGQAAASFVITRMRDDGSWEVDMVASLADGFSKVLLDTYTHLPEDASGDIVREAYKDTVVPAMWAGMAEGGFGDDFARSALALIEAVGDGGDPEG